MHSLHTQMALLDAARALVSFAANWLLQSTLLIAAGMAIAWLLRRRGSALQSAIYRTTLAAVVICPLATTMLARGGVSGWSLRMPAAWENEQIKSSPLGVASVRSQAVEPHDDFDGEKVGWDKRVERAPSHHAERPSRWAGDRMLAPSTLQPAAQQPAPANTPAPQSAAEAHEPSSFHVRTFGVAALGLSLTWLAVSALLLVRLALAWRRLGRLRRAATVAEPAAQQTCRQLSALLTVAAPEVRRSPYLGSPCLAGLLRPVVLLPEAEGSLPLRDVLIHELAHLRRRDGWWNLLTRLTEGVFFYQPLAWTLARRLESAAEEVCDDYVVQFGGDREEYARGLLEIAELSSPPVGAAGVAMVSLRSILARRITRIVDSSRSLSTRAGNLVLAIVIVGGLTCTLVVGFVGLAQHPSANAEPISTTAAKEPAAGTGEKEQKANGPDAETKTKATADDVAQPGKPLAGAAGSSDIDDDLVTVTGKVVDPEGNPFAGAKLYAVRWYWEHHITRAPLAKAQSGVDGRFAISFRKSQFTVDLGRVDQWKNTTIVATADGFSPGWITWRDIPNGGTPTLQLVADDTPVMGRVVDLEGHPLAGVSAKIGYLHEAKNRNLDDWLAAVRRGESWPSAGRYLGDSLPQFDAWSPAAVTDDQGNFRIDGLGRERLAELTFSGPTIAYSQARLVTRQTQPLSPHLGDRTFTVYGADLRFAASPTRPIVGIVRDAATGNPLSGVGIESWRFAGGNYVDRRVLRTVTDASGHYRLSGMPKGNGNQILAVPNDDQPYFMRKMDVPDERGLEPCTVDIELHRGIWVTGQVTDLQSQEPLPARMYYLPFQSNRFAEKFPEFHAPLGLVDGFQQRFETRSDGTYRLVALPGRAIIGALSVVRPYRHGFGADAIEGINDGGKFDTYHNPIQPGKKWPNTLKEINPAPDSQEVVCDLSLDRGETLSVSIVGPDGKRLSGFWADGRTADIEARTISETPTLEVVNLGPDEERTVVIRHDSLQLGKVVRLKIADYPTRIATVVLERYAKIRARLVDRNGDSVVGASITPWILPSQDFAKRLASVATDEEGRFECVEVPTGCNYDLDAEAAGMKVSGWFAKDIAVEPGETKDLGDVVYGVAVEDQVKKPAAAKSEPGKEKTVRGRVVDDKGQPVNQARMRIFHVDAESGTWIHRGRILAETRSDALGKFSIDYANPSAFAAREHFTEPSMIVLADADGYACDWHELEPGQQELALTLSSDDVPLEGRVLDLEGRPIQGVRVSVERVSQAAKELGEWIEAAKKNPASLEEEWMMQPINSPKRRNAPKVARFPGSKELWAAPSGFLPSTVTDAQGRFRFRGLGRDRLVRLQLEGGIIAKTWLNAVTHQMPPVPYPESDPRFRVPTCFGRRFDFTTEPDQPIAGVVRDADSGRALRGVEVRLRQYADSLLFVEGFLATVTDDAGRYTLRGVPKPHDPQRSHRLGIIPPDDEPYFRTEVPVAKHGGLEAIECDIRLKRATWLRGRVIDAVTRKPILGLVEYYPFLSNKAAADYPNFVAGMHSVEGDRYPTRGDGTFHLPALPGHGLVAFIAQHADRYPEADGAEGIGGLKEAEGKAAGVYHLASTELTTAVREVELPTDGGDSVCNIELKPLDVAHVALVDPDGGPVSGVVTRRGAPIHIAGWPYDDPWSSAPLPMATAEIVGPRDQYRTLIFLHRERKIAAAVSLSPERDPPRQIVLRACGVISGRIVDANHKPVAHLYVHVNAAAPAGERPTGWARASFDNRHQIDFVRTDEDGRFRLELVPPEIAYVIRGNLGPAILEKTTPVLQPGQSLELGDLVLQPPKPAAPRKGNAAAKPQAAPVAAPMALGSDEDKKDLSSSQPAKEKIVRGQVLGSNGQPVAGAAVFVRLEIYDSDDPPLESTTADAAGRFAVSFRWPEFDERIGAKPDLHVVAAADGWAPDWKQLGKDQPLGDITLTLNDEKPIEGRIVNAEGRPLAGVDLRVQTILRYDNDMMKLVLDDVANDRTILRTCKSWYYGPLPNQPARVTTAPDGRFRVRGLAANTVIILHARGGGIRDAWFRATTAAHDTIRAPAPPAEAPYGPRAGSVLYGLEFDYIAEPGRRVHGTVRDGETRRPVAKAKVLVYQPTTLGGRGNDVLAADTDAAGRYALDGCAKDERLTLSVEPPNGEAAYLPWSLNIADKPGLGPIEQDVDLVKGIELRGRIVDSQTRLPLVADVSYDPLYLNKYAAALYERRANLHSRTSAKPDGSFRIAVPPGPGAVAVSRPRSAPHEYTTVRVSYDDVVRLFEASPSHRELAHSPGLKEGLPDSLPTQEHNGWSFMSQVGEARVTLICPEERQPLEPLEVRLVRGRSLTGRVLDPAGQPLVGVTAFLDNPGFAWQVLESADFTVTALAPDEKREISFYHAGRKLGASRAVTADDAAPLVVRLEKCGAAIGRVLDEDGAPRAEMHVWFYPARSPWSLTSRYAVTGADGRFRTDELIPGGQYELMRSPPGSALGHLQLSRDKLVFAVDSGQTHDLGDLVVKGPVQTVSQKGGTAPAVDGGEPSNSKKSGDSPAGVESGPNRAGDGKGLSSTQPAREKIVRGRVLLPDGKPAVGAELYWARIASTEPRSAMKIDKRGATDADGRFQFALALTDLAATPVPISLVAHKTGFGVAWAEVQRDKTLPDFSLRLVEDLPIRGHIIDTEGRPVAGARISVGSILASQEGSLDAFLLAWKKDWRFSWTKLDRPGGLHAPLGASLSVTTDRDGQFELSGVGVERVAALDIKANGYAYDQLHVLTRQNFDPRPYNDAARSLFPTPPATVRGMIAKLAGPKFEHVVTAELVVRGKVFTGDQEPVAGASVHLDQFGYAPIVSAVTDAAGRYELRGQPRGMRAGVSVYAPESTGLLGRSLQRETTPTQSTLEIDVKLKRGLVLKGRVFDRSTGKGVRAGVRFVPLPDNDFVDENGNEDPSTATNDAGEFRLLVMPGPGVLTAQVHDGPRVEGHEVNPYRQASFSKQDGKRVPTTVDGDDRYFTGRDNTVEFLMTENAVKVVDLKPDGGPATCDLSLDPAKTAKITIEDGQGQPVTGAFIAGLEDSGGAFRMAAPTCTILALGADRPRRVCILHPERRLAAAITLTGKEQGPLKVQLAASASISGRALAPDGQPLADVLVQINYDRRSASDLEHHLNLEREALKTDGDGRFHVGNIVPGERFALDFKQGKTFFRAPVIPLLWDKRALSAGQELELGDVTVK